MGPHPRDDAAGLSSARAVLAWACAIAGLAAYNWWILALFKPGLIASPNELFSDMEVTGQPFATLMQHADLASGLLVGGAFLAIGLTALHDAGAEWAGMMVFALGGALGGAFPEICSDGVNAVCRHREFRFQLPSQQYVHIVAGILEFGGITVALFYAWRRTRKDETRSATIYRGLARAALVGYPILGAAYLVNRLGGIAEACFFVAFTVVVLTQLSERTIALRAQHIKARRHAPAGRAKLRRLRV